MVGKGISLLQSYLDTYDLSSIDLNKIISQKPPDLAKQINTIQGLINFVRNYFESPQLNCIDCVNILAESYSNYLGKNKLLSHTKQWWVEPNKDL
jgi:hypothetical protein